MAGPIRISILANASSAVKGINQTGTAAEGLGRKMRGASVAVLKYGAAFAGLAAVSAVAGLGKLAVGAAEDQQAAAQLAKQLKNTTGATKAQVAAVEDYISRVGVATGVTDDELRPALSQLATASGSVSKAQKLTTLATNVAAGSGAKLAAVSKGLAKAVTTGSVTALAKYGVATKNADGSTKSLGVVLGDLGKKFGGAAATKADTLKGKIDRLKLIASEAGESLGYKLLPPLISFATFVLSKGIPAVTKFAGDLKAKFGPVFAQVGAFIGPLVGKVKSFLSGLGGGSSALTPLLATFQNLGAFITGTVVPAVSTLVTYFASKLVPIFTQYVGIVQTKVIPILASLGAFFTGQLMPALATVYANVASKLKPVFDQLAATFQAKVLPTVSKLLTQFQEAQPTLQRVALVVVKVVGAVAGLAATILAKVLPVVIRFAGFLIGSLVPAVGRVIVTVIKIVGKIVEFGGAVVGAVQKVGEFASKVGDKIDKVLGYFADLAGDIKSKIGDAGKILLGIGGQIIDGLKAGIDAAAHKVTDAVTAIVNKIPKKIREIMGIASPSKVTTSLGEFISAGLAAGITNGTEGVEAAITAVTDKVTTTFETRLKASQKRIKKNLDGKAETKALDKADKKSTKAQKAALKSLQGQYDALRANAAAQDAMVAKIKEAQDAYDGLVEKAQQYADTVRDGVVATGNIVSLAGDTGSIDGLISALQGKVAAAQTYTDIIARLTAAGLNQTSLQQLIDAGVEGGLGTAQAILNGGPAAINSINTLTAQLTAVGTQLGASTSQTMYGAGIQAAAGLVAGLTADLAALTAAGTLIGDTLARAVKKALRIKSPSRVFRSLGRYTSAGLVLGVRDDLSAVKRAGTQLGDTLQAGFGASTMTSIGSTTQPMSIDLRLSAEQIDQLTRGREIRADLDAFTRAGGRSAA